MVEHLKLYDTEIEKKKFHSSKKTINIDEVDMETLLVCDEFAYILHRI